MPCTLFELESRVLILNKRCQCRCFGMATAATEIRRTIDIDPSRAFGLGGTPMPRTDAFAINFCCGVNELRLRRMLLIIPA
jgi:hypothetical protein